MASFIDGLPLQRHVATVMFADVAESVRLLRQSELDAVQRIRGLLVRVSGETVPMFQGEVIERQGDGLLLRFSDPRQAVNCAATMHRLAATNSAAHADQPALQLRIGMHSGVLLRDDTAVYGIGVSLAARIAAFGRPGDTLLSTAVHDQLTVGLDCELQDLGPCHLKHFDEPVRLFRIIQGAPELPSSLRQAISARLKLRPTLVVLPTQVPAASAPTGLADIVTDQLCRELSRSPMLHVISPLSARALRGRSFELGQLYRRWHADYALELVLHGLPGDAGSGTGLRLEARLWRSGADEPVLSLTVAASANDLLSAASDPLGQVVQGVGRRILAVEQRAARAQQALPSLASHTLYLNAVDLLHRVSATDFERARLMLLALSERAPRHAEPLAWLARWFVFKVMQGWSDDSRRDHDQALSYSQRALDLDPESSLALTMAGSVQAGLLRDPQAAQRYYEQALQHNPNESLAWLMSGVAQGFLSAGPSALAASETALGLAPMDPTRHFYDSLAATASLRAGEYTRCIALAQRAIQANATHGSSHRAMAIAQVMLGQVDAARQTVQLLLAVEPQCTLQLYLARVGPITPQSERFAQALLEAGLPPD